MMSCKGLHSSTLSPAILALIESMMLLSVSGGAEQSKKRMDIS
jgi:hypothetical protein